MKKITAVLLSVLFILPMTFSVFADGDISPVYDCDVDGHEYGEWEVVSEPTCTEEGSKVRYCIHCEEPDFGTIPNPTVPHSLGEWTVVTPATCTTAGTESRKCAKCEYTENRTIKALGHKWSEWQTTEVANYSHAGEQKRTCGRCEAFETKTLPMKVFSDVKADKWYTDPIIFCANNGYMSGTSATTFSLSGQITRGQMVVIMAAIAGASGEEVAKYKNYDNFDDVAYGKWYHNAVEWAYANGLCSGTGTRTFSPNTYATREQVALFLKVLATYMGIDTTVSANLGKYTDASSIHSWAKSAMEFAVGKGIISGVTTKALCPRIYTTRANMAVMLQKFDSLIIK